MACCSNCAKGKPCLRSKNSSSSGSCSSDYSSSSCSKSSCNKSYKSRRNNCCDNKPVVDVEFAVRRYRRYIPKSCCGNFFTYRKYYEECCQQKCYPRLDCPQCCVRKGGYCGGYGAGRVGVWAGDNMSCGSCGTA